VEHEFIEVGLRLSTAADVGGIVEISRDLEEKPIGVRMLGLVALGAAIVSAAAVQGLVWPSTPML